MTSAIFDPAGKAVRGVYDALDAAIITQDTPLVVGGSTAPATVRDTSWNQSTGAVTYNNAQLQVGLDASGQAPAFTALTPAVATISPSGAIAWVSDGAAQFQVVSRYSKRVVSRNMTHTSTQSYTSVADYAPGTLAYHLNHGMDEVLALSTPGQTQQQQYQGSVANPQAWVLKGPTANWTPFPSNVQDMLNQGYITPKHFITAAHVKGLGQNGAYRDVNGNALISGPAGTALYSNGVQVGTTNYYFQVVGDDTVVCYQPGANTPTASILKTLPANWATYLPTIGGLSTTVPSGLASVPVVWNRYNPYTNWNQSWEVYELTGDATFSPPKKPSYTGQNAAVDRTKFYSGPIHGGDSGSPLVLNIQGNPVILANINFAATFERFYPDLITQINAAIASTANAAGDATAAAYTIGTVSLASFSQP